MGRIVVSQFITVDGVIEDPGGAEGFDRGGWAFAFERGDEGDRFKFDEVMAPTLSCSVAGPTRASPRRGPRGPGTSRTSSTRCRSTSSRRT